MPRLGIYSGIAWQEIRDGLRGPLVPLIFCALVGYVLLSCVSSDLLKDMGGAGVVRNSHLFVYQMTSGQSFWLFFAWAWLFGQVVSRDRMAQLHELVLCTPVSLSGLLLARFLGALTLGCLLASSSSVALLLIPMLAEIGLLPSNSVGPTPYLAISRSWALFVFPTALGMGALNLVGALRSRGAGGSYAVAAFVFLLWMTAMIVMRTGDVHDGIATIIDASCYGEAEAQTKAWTPQEKANAHLVLNTPLIINRLLWTFVPILVLAWTITRQTRETLVLDRGNVAVGHRQHREQPATHARSGETPGRQESASPRPNWPLCVFNEARWHLYLTVRSWAFRITIGMWITLCVAGTFAHVVGHAEGPLIPRPEILTPFIVDLSYWFAVFIVAGYVGTLARRDRQPGFSEMIDAAIVPVGARVMGKVLAVTGFVVILALGSTFATWIAMALAAPAAFEAWTALLFNLFVATPAMLELAAITFAVHAWVRSPGTAHALSALVAFVAIVNHELGITPYPPAQIGVALHLCLSELTGPGAWLDPALAVAGLKAGLASLFYAAAWVSYPRGTDLTLKIRGRHMARRLFSPAGAIVPGLVALIAISVGVLHQRVIEKGGFQSLEDKNLEAAQWEATLATNAPSEFTVAGGILDATVDPWARKVSVRILFERVQITQPKLHAELRHGMHIESAAVDGSRRNFSATARHLVIDTKGCVEKSCDIQLQLTVDASGWLGEEEPPWLHRTGVWLSASHIIPRLGVDPARLLRAQNLRAEHNLPEHSPTWPGGALVSAGGAAPTGDWRWSLTWSAPGRTIQSPNQATHGVLDFGAVWLPENATVQRQRGKLEVWHGPTHADAARQISTDVVDMQRCISSSLESTSQIQTVVQSPRDLGTVHVHGSILLLPEHLGWDLEPESTGRWRRRMDIATALAKHQLVAISDLRKQPGSRWLSDGVAQWLALDCVRQLDGLWAWQHLVERQALRIEDAFGALNAPITGLAADGQAEWINDYAGLATSGWATVVGRASALSMVRSVSERVREGDSIRTALTEVLGSAEAARILDEPWSSELRITASDHERFAVGGQRFRWHEGGWQEIVDVRIAPALFSVDGSTQLLDGSGATLDPAESFAVYDAWPGFERSPPDNARRSESTSGKAPDEPR